MMEEILDSLWVKNTVVFKQKKNNTLFGKKKLVSFYCVKESEKSFQLYSGSNGVIIIDHWDNVTKHDKISAILSK